MSAPPEFSLLPFLFCFHHLGVVVNERVAHLVDDGGAGLALEAEGGLDDGHLGGGGVETGEGAPVVDDHAGANDLGTAVDGSGDEGHLQQRRELVQLRTGGLGVDETALEGDVSVWDKRGGEKDQIVSVTVP